MNSDAWFVVAVVSSPVLFLIAGLILDFHDKAND